MALPLTNCVALVKLIDLSDFDFLLCRMKDLNFNKSSLCFSIR